MSTIKINSGGRAATINKPGATSSATVNRITPVSATIRALDRHTIEVSFPSPLTPAIDDFVFNNGAALTINAVEGSGETWLFDIQEDLTDSDIISATYDSENIPVTNSIPAFQLITGDVSKTNCDYVDPLISSSGTNGWGHTFLDSKSIPANTAGRIMFKYILNDFNGYIGLKTTNAEGSYTTFKVAVMMNASGNLQRGVDGAAPTSTSFLPRSGTWLALKRASVGSFSLEWSNDKVYWNFITTLSVSSTVQLWVVGDLFHPGKIRSATFELPNEFSRPANTGHLYNCNIIGHGNSLMAGFGLSFKMDDITITKYPFRRAANHSNLGQSGRSTDQLTSAANVTTVSQKFRSGVVNYLLFWEMCNYVSLYGTDAQAAVDAVAVYSSTMYAKAVEMGIDLRIIHLTTFRRTTFNASYNLAIDQANQLLREQWNTMDGVVGVADVGADARFLNPADTTYFNADGIHQSALGLQISEQITREKLLTL